MIQKPKLTYEQWLEVNGFSQEGETYVILGSSFAIKEQLKQNDFKFSPLFKWHAATADYTLPESCSYQKISFQDFFTWDAAEGVAYLRDGARDKLELIFNPKRESDSQSTFVGAIGDKINDLAVELRYRTGYDTIYGYKNIYTFKDSDGNLYSWHSTTNQPIAEGAHCRITGTIKGHSEYKGVKTTILTRCKLNIN